MKSENGIPYMKIQRLRFIDLLLGHYGMVSKAVIEDYFGLSQGTVSEDFADYLDFAPRNMQYNHSKRRYERTTEFKRVWP